MVLPLPYRTRPHPKGALRKCASDLTTLPVPRRAKEGKVSLLASQLAMLLEGIDLGTRRPQGNVFDMIRISILRSLDSALQVFRLF